MENLDKLQEEVKVKLGDIAEDIHNQIPKDFGFAVLIFPFGEHTESELMYASNANREDVCTAMLEFVYKTKNNYGNDTGKY